MSFFINLNAPYFIYIINRVKDIYFNYISIYIKMASETETGRVVFSGAGGPVSPVGMGASVSRAEAESPVSEEFNVDELSRDKFEEMELKEGLLKGIYNYGFTDPSTIQQKAILPVVSGRDIIAQSQSGTGKTGTFTISTLQRINQELKAPQAIILSPTRELAKQIYNVVNELSKFMELKTYLMTGGTRRSRYTFSDDSDMNSQVIVGTPGRISENITKRKLPLDNLKIVVIDEADEVLSQGFREQLFTILSNIPSTTQIAMFSATIPDDMIDFTKKFMNNPIKILIKKEEITLQGIKQYYVALDREEQKLPTIMELYGFMGITQAMIYVNSKKKVEWLAYQLRENGFTVSCMTGDMSEEERSGIMADFRRGKTRILLSTDLLSRGIDVQTVSLVLNYDLPIEKETYIHRIGRSGRFGRRGVAINFVTPRDSDKFRTIEEYYHTSIEELPADVERIIGSTASTRM